MRIKFLLDDLKRNDGLENLDAHGRIILKLILKKYGVRCGLDSSGSGLGPVGRLEHSNEPQGSVKDLEFLDQLSNC
jgi:hypothetical protein